MKLSCLRPLAALLLTLGLAACGGKASYDVSGTVSNLNNNGLILANGGEELPIAAGQTSFTLKSASTMAPTTTSPSSNNRPI